MLVNDLSSALFNSFLGIGQIAGPIFGSFVTKMTSFQTCCDIVAIISLIFSIMYYICADGFTAFRTSSCKQVEPVMVIDDSQEFISLKVDPQVSFLPVGIPRIDSWNQSTFKLHMLKRKSNVEMINKL